MSTLVRTPSRAGRAAPSVPPVPGPAEREEMRRRGRLVLAERVVEKIAGQAATEVAAASGRSGGFLGIGADADPAARAKVDVTLSGESADLSLALGIAYPGSIRRAVQQVREHVTERVETLTGVDVHRVDVEVAFLTTSDAATRKVALR